jgi:hypothetical protein
MSYSIRILSPLLLATVALGGPLAFEPNRGQTHRDATYLARSGTGLVLFTATGVVVSGTGAASGFEFPGADSRSRWEGLDPTGAVTTYHVGRDPSKWVSQVPSYRRLIRRSLYPGVDLLLYGNAGHLEYDFVLAPHADPAQIRLRFTGTHGFTVDADGSLRGDTAAGPVFHRRPVLYSLLPSGERRAVEGAYRRTGSDEVRFRPGSYDPELALTIDPVLDYSSYVGGSGEDTIVAAIGGGVFAGNTTSIDFPGASFARRENTDIFFRAGSVTYIYGGSGNDVVTGASLPSTSVAYGQYNVYIGGYTDSTDLPTAAAAGWLQGWQPEYAGGATDGFLVAVNVSSSNGVSAGLTYVGTSGDDRVTAVSLSGTTFGLVGYTTGGGLTLGTTYGPFQAEPAGGVDGFFMTGSFSPTYVNVDGSSYLGGSGDDRPLAIYPVGSSYYIAGETSSPDLPVNSQRNGDSDAFVVQVSLGQPLQISAGVLFGGSGTDRGTALTISSKGHVMLAGVTASADLPVISPRQSAYGGGDSDAFVAEFTYALDLVSATWLGGSGTDEATSITTDSYGPVTVGGWTSSNDFPVSDAVQPTFGGGAEDGFMVQFDIDGTILQSTYFGGSGADRILGVTSVGGPTVLVAGTTQSPDLPLVDAEQTSLKGASDGFSARIASNILLAEPVTGGKDLRIAVPVVLGGLKSASTATVNVVSSNPGLVQVAALLNDGGDTSAHVSASGTSATYYSAGFYADCLADTGSATLTLSATGYPDRTVPVSCFPGRISISLGGSRQQVGTTSSVSAVLAAHEPGLAGWGKTAARLRPGVGPLTFELTNSNPAAGTLSPSSLSFTESAYSSSAKFTALAAGKSEISVIDSSGLQVGPNTITVTARTTPSSTSLSIPAGFQNSVYLNYSYPAPQPTATVSSDSASVALSLDPTQSGTSSVTVPLGSTQVTKYIYVQVAANASGDTSLTLRVDGQDDIAIPIHITSPVAAFTASLPGQSVPLGVGASLAIGGFVSNSDGKSCTCLPLPGTSVRFGAAVGDSSVVQAPEPAELGTKTYGAVSLAFTALAEGRTTVTLTPPDGIPLRAHSLRTFDVVVRNKAVRLDNLELGKDLAARMTVVLPRATTAATAVRLTVSDQSLVLLSPDATTAGRGQLDLSVAANASNVTFYAYGLAATGQASVTAAVTGFDAATATVTLRPSGFGWLSERLAVTLYSTSTVAAVVSVFALDPDSLIPIGTQALRPGVAMSVPVSSSNPGVVPVPSDTLRSATMSIVPATVGETTFSLGQPVGFTIPRLHQDLTVQVSAPAFSIPAVTVGKDAQATFVVICSNVRAPANLSVTVTSSDPSRLLLAPDTTTPGTASLTIPFNSMTYLYLQGLDDHGTVTVEVSAPSFQTATAAMQLVPSGIGLTVNNSSGSASSTTAGWVTASNSAKTKLVPQLYALIPQSGGTPQATSASLRPGAGPFTVGVTSSNPAVARIDGSPASYSASAQTGVDLVPVAAGDMVASVEQPPGFTAVPGLSAIKFSVAAPAFAAATYVAAKDTFGQISLGLLSQASAMDTNLTVTLTSSDPALLLLSGDASSAPTASITQVLVAGRKAIGPFYVHALAGSGTGQVRVSAPGLADSTLSVVLTGLGFGFDTYPTSVSLILQSGISTTRVKLMAMPVTGFSGTGITPVLRPGAAEITVGLQPSDSTVISTDPSQLVFKPGMSQADVKVRPLSLGTAALSLDVPAGYGKSDYTRIEYTVTASSLSFGYAVSGLGRDLQAGVVVSAQGGFPQATTLTVTSADPSRLLVSVSTTAPGSGAVNIEVKAGGLGTVYLQSLADSGTADVTVSAEGYQPSTTTVKLTPSAAVFSANTTSPQSVLTTSSARQLEAMLRSIDPVTLLPFGTAALPRPGANLSATVISSDDKVVPVSPATVPFGDAELATLPAGNYLIQKVSAQPLAAGTATISLSPLSGGATAAANRQVVFNVSVP